MKTTVRIVNLLAADCFYENIILLAGELKWPQFIEPLINCFGQDDSLLDNVDTVIINMGTVQIMVTPKGFQFSLS